ncbi:MAG: 3-deoxy-D-manno-octulosonic acid transferase [bacterium]
MHTFVAPNKSPREGKVYWFNFYNFLALPVMSFLLWLIAVYPFPSRIVAKIREGIQGRRNLFEDLAAQLQGCAAGQRVWIHASSMGECEQAQPILRELHSRFPQAVRVLTLFSPSAYAHLVRPNLPAEVVCYLPFDRLPDVRRFFDLVKPATGIFIRHDLWPNFLWEARRRGVTLILADASVSMNASSLRHKPVVRHFHREIFANFDWIGAVSQTATESLLPLVRSPERLRQLGDTRYDQVLFRTQAGELRRLLPADWQARAHTFVAGSTWPPDEEIVIPALAAARTKILNARMILVPHEPTEEHLQGAEKLLHKHRLTGCRLSKSFSQPATEVLLVDRVGVLAELYGAGSVAFVGGSFGPGVHSVLEAAAHSVPVLFGPRMRNSAEAVEMEQVGIGKIISNAEEAARTLIDLLADLPHAQAWGQKCRAFVEQKAGAAREIVRLLE